MARPRIADPAAWIGREVGQGEPSWICRLSAGALSEIDAALRHVPPKAGARIPFAWGRVRCRAWLPAGPHFPDKVEADGFALRPRRSAQALRR